MAIPRARIRFVLAIALAALLIASIGGGPGGGRFGDPLPGLTDAQRAAFDAGKTAFGEQEFAHDGLGPVFTDNACANCHSVPALGGGSAIVETRIGRVINGVFDPLVEFGGPVIQNKAIDETTGYIGPYT